MKLFFHIRLPANHPIHGFFLPNLFLPSGSFVDLVRARGFDALKDFTQGPEHRFSFLILLPDLRLKKKVNVVRHHTSSKELILALFVRVKNALEYEIPLGRI